MILRKLNFLMHIIKWTSVARYLYYMKIQFMPFFVDSVAIVMLGEDWKNLPAER